MHTCTFMNGYKGVLIYKNKHVELPPGDPGESSPCHGENRIKVFVENSEMSIRILGSISGRPLRCSSHRVFVFQQVTGM